MSGCETCGKRLGRSNKSGLCRKHFGAVRNAGPEQSALSRVRWQDPTYRARVLRHLLPASRRRLEWCPVEYREDYRVLTRKCKTAAKEAKAIILARIAEDALAYQQSGQLQQTRRAA